MPLALNLGKRRYISTTTRYGTNPFTACGLDSGALVEGTDYLAVASAQAMQDGCCRCNRAGGGGQTAPGHVSVDEDA